MLIRHFARLPSGQIILWLFLIWYLVMAGLYFEPLPRLWLNALGMSLVIGSALVLSVRHDGSAAREFWRLFRLYTIPFCVSSFSSLVRDDGFYVIFAPAWRDNLVALASCAAFGGWVLLARSIEHGRYRDGEKQ
ncbi:MAG: hypothetical protein RQ741_11205 [Wenzhouxiangellaceae bacterium]|nr:hypothetical protein [Wenzhouxiangellaceae bacterium]